VRVEAKDYTVAKELLEKGIKLIKMVDE